VRELVSDWKNESLISRLCILELHSVFAQKIRAGEISEVECTSVLRRFRGDIRKRRFRVVSLRLRHFELAGTLIGNYATSGLRALDSLHLAVAVDLRRNGLIDFDRADAMRRFPLRWPTLSPAFIAPGLRRMIVIATVAGAAWITEGLLRKRARKPATM
jgi:hypothetical protein